MKDKLVIYCDGGARNNPGPAAVGVVIGKRTYSEYIGEATNNEAEYKAVIYALKKAKALIGKKEAENTEVEIRLDSELAAKQLKGEYKLKEKKLHPLFIEVWNLKQDFKKVEFFQIPREKNKTADSLVNQRLDRQLF